jgi:tetratricopeptide (TPR) repeat protein
MKKMMYLVAFSLLVVGCSSSGKFGDLTSDNFSVDPKVMEVRGGGVPVMVTGTFPAKFFPKDGELEFTPVMISKGRSVKGEKIVFYGEKAKNPGLLIVSHQYGGVFSETQSFPYSDDMRMSELCADIKCKQGGKVIRTARIKLADGIITTPMLVDPREASMITRETYGMGPAIETTGAIQYVIQKSDVRKTELSKPEMVGLMKAIKNSEGRSFILITSAASPDGAEGRNSRLAHHRDMAATKCISDELKKMKMDVPIEHAIIDEDWDGLYTEIGASNLKNKEEIIQKMKAENDIDRRQVILHGYMRTDKLFDASLLPALRRSVITLHTEGEPMTSAVAIRLIEVEPASMSLNDKLRATAEMSDRDKQIVAYRTIIRMHPDDWRAYNNLGVAYMFDSNWDEASGMIDRSIRVQERPENKYNKGFVHLAKGNMQEAKVCFSNVSSSPEWSNASGAAEILNGNYPAAVAIYGNMACNNAALAQIMNNDCSRAASTLSRIEHPNATTFYLKAIVGARTQNKDMVYNNLKEVKARDKRLANLAKTDIEFASCMKDSRFTSMLQ